MQYVLLFLEGIITFISPCLLPMLPIYVSFFAAGTSNRARTIRNALGFIAGFTLVFVLLGAFAGAVGGVLRAYGTAINIVTGIVVILLGLNFIGVFKIGFLNQTRYQNMNTQNLTFVTSLLFGIVFSLGWTPCVGAFLASALMMASQSGDVVQGVVMLLLFSLGLGIPFFVSALLIDRVKSAFDFIKRHYNIINIASGVLLIVVGILMATGLYGRVIAMLSM